MTVETATAPQATTTGAEANKPAEAAAENKTAVEPAAKVEPKDVPTAAKVVPEKYELKLPEGSHLKAPHLERLSAFAKEQGLSQEEANKVLLRDHELATAHVVQAQEELKNRNENDWKQELIGDKEFGGEKFEQNGVLAYQAAEKFFGGEFANELKTMNLNHHPRLFRGLVRIAKAMADDRLVQPGNGAKEDKSMAEVFYGKPKE